MRNHNRLLTAAALIPLMGAPAGTASAECVPEQQGQGEADLTIVISVDLVPYPPAPPAPDDNISISPILAGPAVVEADMRDPANAMINRVGLALGSGVERSPIDSLAGNDDQFRLYIGEQLLAVREPFADGE